MNKILSSSKSILRTTAIELETRRSKLSEALGPSSAAIIPGYGLRYKTNGIFYEFHQNTNLLYFTGFNEPDAGCVLETDNNGQKTFSMFVQPMDPNTRIWDGPRFGLEGVKKMFHADKSYSISQFEPFLYQLDLNTSIKSIYSDLPLTRRLNADLLQGTHIRVKSASAVHVDSDTSISRYLQEAHLDMDDNASSSRFMMDWIGHHRPSKNGTRIESLAPIVDQLRLTKSEMEIKIMRECGRITGRAFAECMRQTGKSIKTEHQLWAAMDYFTRMNGADCLAYVPVVAGGENGLTLHYVQNSAPLGENDLVLVDAGAELHGYCSDITRTWPVSGKFTSPQAQVYQAVLTAQKQIIKKCQETLNVSLNDLQRETVGLLKDSCQQLFKRTVSESEMDVLFPHHVGHYLGLDVHDTPSISRQTKLKSGMVVTIEPGLYIPHSSNYPPEFRGIAVRIEDDVAIGGPSTNHAPITLSVEAPKEMSDVEAVLAGLV